MSVLALGKQGVRLDLTINLGQVITAVAMLVSLVSAYWALSTQIALNEARVSNNQMAIVGQQKDIRMAVETLQAIKTDIAVIRFRLDGDGKDPLQSRR